MRPRWKIIVELLWGIFAVLIGSSMVVAGIEPEPDLLPGWLMVVLGSLICWRNFNRIEARWKEL